MISLYFFTLSSLQPQVLFQQNSSSLNFLPFFLLCFLWYTREWDSWVPRCQRSHVPDLSDGILVQTLLKLMPIPTASHPKSVQSGIGLTSCGRPASGLMGTQRHTHLSNRCNKLCMWLWWGCGCQRHEAQGKLSTNAVPEEPVSCLLMSKAAASQPHHFHCKSGGYWPYILLTCLLSMASLF